MQQHHIKLFFHTIHRLSTFQMSYFIQLHVQAYKYTTTHSLPLGYPRLTIYCCYILFCNCYHSFFCHIKVDFDLWFCGKRLQKTTRRGSRSLEQLKYITRKLFFIFRICFQLYDVHNKPLQSWHTSNFLFLSN